MAMKKIFFILITVFIVACSSETTVSIPDTVLPQEKMAKVMVEVHLLEATLNMNAPNPNNASITLPGNAIVPNADIFKSQNITKEQYDESFVFYTQHPTLLVEIYQLVLNDLSKMQAEVMTEK
jgi:hypothetical protein